VNESLDRRILGAFVCVDAMTGDSVPKPVRVTALRWTIKPNRSGIYVIFDGPGFNLLTTQFLPSGIWPAPVSFEVTLQDPNRRYLPRRANVKAPLNVPLILPAPSNSPPSSSPPSSPPPSSPPNSVTFAALQDPGSVFNPQLISLYPVPSAPFGPNWAVIHASVTRTGTTPPQGLPWAILQVTRNSDHTVLATGQANASGEALLAVIGRTSETNTSSKGPVTLPTVAVTVTALFDPGVLSQPPSWIPNPDDILNNPFNPILRSTSQSVPLGSGQELPMSFAISV
jgi:hypothetical protein